MLWSTLFVEILLIVHAVTFALTRLGDGARRARLLHYGGLRDSGFLLASSLQEHERQRLPVHKRLKKSQLDNGLQYIFLPHANPPHRFEAHLEIFSGSVDEKDNQLGLAHLCEHIAYMGSEKRELILRKTVTTNAYTDFHHTVFFAACPVEDRDSHSASLFLDEYYQRRERGGGGILGGSRRMLGKALAALRDVLEGPTQFSTRRMEKERQAVLSEASMVNTAEYRHECQMLGNLHRENLISKRFPIGSLDLLKKYSVEDVKRFHSMHYRPNNCCIYVVGDLDSDEVESEIRYCFESILPSTLSSPLSGTVKDSFPSFPPVRHNFHHRSDREKISAKPLLWQHPLLQSVSICMMVKHPIKPTQTVEDFRHVILRRMILFALTQRLQIFARKEALFHYVLMSESDSVREGCSVCALDIQTDAQHWKQALAVAIAEVRRIGIFGIADKELKAIKATYTGELDRHHYDRAHSSDVIKQIMENNACHHTTMSPQDERRIAKEIIAYASVQEISDTASNLTDWLVSYRHKDMPPPCGIVACLPLTYRDTQKNETVPLKATEKDLINAIDEAAAQELHDSTDTSTFAGPKSLYSQEQVEALKRKYSPKFVPLTLKPKEKDSSSHLVIENNTLLEDQSLKLRFRQLNNGIRLNIRPLPAELNNTFVRVIIPVGRFSEDETTDSIIRLPRGSTTLGGKTIMEGGAFDSFSREQVELYCSEHLVSVLVDSNDEFITMDFEAPSGIFPHNIVSGTESIFQIVRAIFTNFKFEQDAFDRARQAVVVDCDRYHRDFNTRTVREFLRTIANNDQRLEPAPYEAVQKLTFESITKIMKQILQPQGAEISISGDISVSQVEKYCLDYLGTIPSPAPHQVKQTPFITPKPFTLSKESSQKHHQPVRVHIRDSDLRAVSIVAGLAPNKWGLMPNGSLIFDNRHPSFFRVALSMLHEIINKRLFSLLREEKQLTYDASFEFVNFDVIHSGFFTATVHTNPEQAMHVLNETISALEDLGSSKGINNFQVESARRHFIHNMQQNLHTARGWLDEMAGIQLAAIPYKTTHYLREAATVAASISTGDLQRL